MKDTLEIWRLKQLLAGRKVEYFFLGATSEDREKDTQIMVKIKELENENN
ncbi:hypothetical protein LCGC14_2973660 [marine sediment metagenome]|uniref:Uncharacterized protein n=1 Tax=marine sediment metagenome TaxID=412755 RepID=A0A0F8ZGC0_9ZZZZ